MVTILTTPPTATSRVGTDNAPARRDNGGGLPLGAVEDVTGLTFEALLESTVGNVTPPDHNCAQGETSPSRMFEASPATGHEQRLETLREQGRSSAASRATDARTARTSIEARTTLSENRASNTSRPLSTDGPASPGLSLGSSSPSAKAEGAGGADQLDISPHGRSAARSAHWVESPVNARGASHGQSAAEITPPAQTHAVGELTRPMHSAASATVSQVAAAGGSKAQTPAGQVAQLLGAARAGEAESARAPTSAADTSGGRQAGLEKGIFHHSSSAQDQSAKSSSQESAREGAKLGATRQSVFDELIRSIRLRTGVRQSSARLHLEPPELGRLRVDVKVVGDLLQVGVRTESEAARGLLSGRVADLAAALERHGIHVENFEVTSDLFDSDPLDQRDGESTESDVTANWKRDGRLATSRSQAHETAVEWTDVSGMADAAPDMGVVAETRLDIRV